MPGSFACFFSDCDEFLTEHLSRVDNPRRSWGFEVGVPGKGLQNRYAPKYRTMQRRAYVCSFWSSAHWHCVAECVRVRVRS